MFALEMFNSLLVPAYFWWPIYNQGHLVRELACPQRAQ